MKKMKTIKKILTGFITAFIIMTSSCIPTFAAEADISNNNSFGSSLVQYAMNSGWSASIPAFITPSVQDEVNTKQYGVDVSDIVLGNNEKLVTTIEYDGRLVEANGIEIPYTLYDANGEISTGYEIISTDSGNPDAIASYKFGAALNQSPKYAGIYMGTATFNFATVEKTIVYTAEDIEKDEHLFPIGKTKPEFVVVKYNDDYTQADIFANGKISDGRMKDFDFSNNLNRNLKNVNIKSGVTTIGNSAFYQCQSLTNITIPDGITSIGKESFYYCKSLTNINIPDSVTTIGSFAFSNCSSLSNISIPNNITSIESSTFYKCSSLSSINIPNSVTSIGSSAFSYCTSLVNIIIPDSVTSIGNSAFTKCSNLKTIYGYSNTYAETWANSNGYTFVAID